MQTGQGPALIVYFCFQTLHVAGKGPDRSYASLVPLAHLKKCFSVGFSICIYILYRIVVFCHNIALILKILILAFCIEKLLTFIEL